MVHPSIFDIEKAKQEATPWPYQDIIDVLVESGFARIDPDSTYNWWGKVPTNHISYAFTAEGKEACFRNKYTTPMAWAEDIQKGARHCVVCMRDCYRTKVWAQVKGRSGVVCISCGAKGHGLHDLSSPS